MTCVGENDNYVKTFQISINNYQKFDEPVPLPENHEIIVKTNRMGSIADVSVSDVSLMKLSPDVVHLFVFIPNDAVRIGDRWKKIMHLPIPPIRGADIPSVRSISTDMCYVRDENVTGRECRLFRTTAAIWLNELRITPDELLQHASINYRLKSGKGGRYELKCEQWIDKETGVVVKAKAQSRVVMWIQDVRKPKKYTIFDVDNDMVLVTSQKIMFDLE